MSVLTSFTMTVTVLCLPLIMLTLLTVPPSSPTPVTSVSEENGNMNVSNLGEALFLLTSVFISAVQPTPARTVGLQYIMPHISFPGAMGEFPSIFRTYNKTRQSSAINVTAVMTKTRAAKEGPGEVLRALCEDTFPNNVVTVLHINNPAVASDFVDVSPYLTRLLDSVGLPVISWDTQFSTESQVSAVALHALCCVRTTRHSLREVGSAWHRRELLSVGRLTSQQHASVSQGRIYSDSLTCCHTEIEVADQTFHLTQSQYTDTGPTSPSADPITPGAWQGSH